MENAQAQFQMLDNYVKEYTLKCKEKLAESMDINMDGQVKFRIVNIRIKHKILLNLF